MSTETTTITDLYARMDESTKNVHVAYAIVKANLPEISDTRSDLFNIHELLSGKALVRVTSNWGAKTVMGLIETEADYFTYRNDSPDSFWKERDAEIQLGWRRPYNSKPPAQPKPLSREVKLALEVENKEVRLEADRIVREKTNPVEPLQLLSVSDLLDQPAPEWWIDGVLPKDAVVVVGGDGGVGKSALLVEMVARLSTGTPFLQQYSARKAKTLYAVGEGVNGYGARFKAVGHARGLDADQVKLVSKGVSLTSEKSMEQVRDAVATSKFDIVIFDTLSSLSTLESENDAAEVARVLNNAKLVREANPGCTVIIVHHTNKASGGLRGSSVIRDNADMVWMLRGDPDAFFMSSRGKHGGKVKDGEPTEIHGLSLVGAHGSVIVESATMPSDGGAGAAMEQRSNKLAERLTLGMTYSTKELRDLARIVDPSISDATAKRIITTLISMGILSSTGRGQYLALAGQDSGGSMTL